MPAGLEDLFGRERPGEPDEAAGEFRRALVVAAHPDDADFGAAGAAALLARAGWEVRYLVVTDGSKGSDDPAIAQPELIAMRAAEQHAAAAILGVGEVRFLGHTDGELVWSHALIGEIVREIRAFRPFAVYTHDPEAVIVGNAFVSHSDHRATGLAAVDAVYPAARDRLNFPEQVAEGLQPHKVRELYLFGGNASNHAVDITDVIETKLAAMRAHTSQFPPDLIERMREYWRDADGRYHEQFRRVIMFI